MHAELGSRHPPVVYFDESAPADDATAPDPPVALCDVDGVVRCREGDGVGRAGKGTADRTDSGSVDTMERILREVECNREK